jgi:sortase A
VPDDVGGDVSEPHALSRPRRPNRFDRPPEPHDWRWFIGHVGRVLIALGLLMFAFVAYQLWGTGIQTAAKQNELRSEFEAMLRAAPTPVTSPATTSPVTTSPGTDGPATSDPASTEPASTEPASTEPVSTIPDGPVVTIAPPPLPERRDPLALLEIPAIDVDEVVIEGTRTADLRDGPGHFPETPLPGQLGNSAIAGHRTTFGAPFYRVDELQANDPIIVTTLTGRYVYAVTDVFIIGAEDYGVVIPTVDLTTARLTLISCHPRYTAQQRIVVQATLVLSESAPPAAAPVQVKPADIAPGETLPDDGLPEESTTSSSAPATDGPETSAPGNTTPGNTTPATNATPTTTGSAGSPDIGEVATVSADGDAFNEGWFSDDRAFPQVALWGTVLSLVSLAAYAVSRRARRYWVGALVGVIPFTIVLYFFFQNVNRLLPPGL